MRGGMLNGRASRRTQISNAIQEDKTSAGIGTSVRHLPRERIETVKIEKIRSALPREGVAALPYTDISNY